MSIAVSIDKAGRVVIPKTLRDRMRFSPGSTLQAEVVGDKLELALAPTELTVVKRGARRVVAGGEPFDAGLAVSEAREDYLERLQPKRAR